MLVVPLIFFSLVAGVAAIGDLRKLGAVGGRAMLGEALRDYPSIAVQDVAASHVVDGLEDEGEEIVVDICAGRGTKTRQLLAKFPEARVIACEIDEDRLRSLRSVFADEPRVEVSHVDALEARGQGWGARAGLRACARARGQTRRYIHISGVRNRVRSCDRVEGLG